MKHLVLIMTAVCFWGNTLMAAAPNGAKGFRGKEEGQFFMFQFIDEATKRKIQQKREELLRNEQERKRRMECVDQESFFNESQIEIPGSFDLPCILTLAFQDFGHDSKAIKELIDEMLLTLPDVYHENVNAIDDASVSFFSLDAKEQERVLKDLDIYDTAIHQLIRYLPATLDGTCPIDTKCPEGWLRFFQYLYEQTESPFWQELYDFTYKWYTRESREEWYDALGDSVGVVFYAKDQVDAACSYGVERWDHFAQHVEDKITMFNENNYFLHISMAVVLFMYASTIIVYIRPNMIDSTGIKVGLLGAGMIASVLMDRVVTSVAVEYKSIEEALFFHRFVTTMVNLMIAYRTSTWLPASEVKNYLVAFPVFLEAVRQVTIAQFSGKQEIGYNMKYRMIRAFDVGWAMYILYLGGQYFNAERAAHRQGRAILWGLLAMLHLFAQQQQQAAPDGPVAAPQEG